MARRNPNEGSVMSLQSGLFKLLLPLPNVSQTSLAKRLAPGGESKEDNAVLFLLHPRQPLSMIAVSLSMPCCPAQSCPVLTSTNSCSCPCLPVDAHTS